MLTIVYKQKSLREREDLSFLRLGDNKTESEAVSSQHDFCFISFMTEQSWLPKVHHSFKIYDPVPARLGCDTYARWCPLNYCQHWHIWELPVAFGGRQQKLSYVLRPGYYTSKVFFGLFVYF